MNLTTQGLADLYPPLASGRLRANMITTQDHCLAVGNSSRPISNETDHQILLHLRQISTGILVTSRTAVLEEYRAPIARPEYEEIRRELDLPSNPLLVISTTTANTARRLVETYSQQKGRVMISLFCSDDRAQTLHSASPDVEVLTLPAGDEGLRSLRGLLQQRYGGSWLCEGGPTLLKAVDSIGWIDELCLTVTPNRPDLDCSLKLDILGSLSRPFKVIQSEESEGVHYLRYEAGL